MPIEAPSGSDIHTPIRKDIGLPDLLTSQFHRLHRRLAGISIAGGLGLTLFVTCSLLAIVLLMDVLLDLSISFRAGMLVLVPVVAFAMACWSMVRPWARRYSVAELAALVEASHPELHERLISTVEIAEQRSQHEPVGSELMQAWLLQQTVDFARVNDFSDVIDARRAIRRCWMGGMALFALLLPLVFASNAYAVLWTRFLNPWGNLERPQNLVLTIDNPDRTVGRGDDVLILAHPSWRFAEGTLPESGCRQFPAQPFPAIHADMHGERQRGLDPHMAQAPHRMQEVDIPVQAFPQCRSQIDLFFDGIAVDVERAARFHTTEHADDSLLDLLPPEQFLHQGFLGEGRRGEILDFSARSTGHRLDRGFQLLGQLQGKPLEFLEQDMLLIEPGEQPGNHGQDSHGATKADAIPTAEHAEHLCLMFFDKLIHGVALVRERTC
jgi:hypothetical protein